MGNVNYKEGVVVDLDKSQFMGRDEIQDVNNDIEDINKDISDLNEKIDKVELVLDANIVNICEHVSRLESKIKLVSFMSIINLIISILIISIIIICIF